MRHATRLGPVLAVTALAAPAAHAAGSDGAAAVPDFAIAFSASEVIGDEALSPDGAMLGEVEDVLVPREGAPVALVLSVGGVLGLGDKRVAVQMDDVSLAGEDRVRIEATREQIEDRAPFDRDDLSLAALAPIGFGAIEPGEGQESRRRYLDTWSTRMDHLETAVEDGAGSPEARAAVAWDRVRHAWRALQQTPARNWAQQRRRFEDAYQDFDETWNRGGETAGDFAPQPE